MIKTTTHTDVLRTLAAMLLAVLLAPPTHARPTPPPLEDPAHWSTVTHAGNAPHTYLDGNQTRQVGRVDYEYQISKTEVTTAEWVDFVNAYAPYAPLGDQGRSWFTSTYVFRSGPGAAQPYFVPTVARDYGIEVGWRYAARYCNWLHNGKATNREAFESGAYDTSTFTDNPDHTFNDQRTRSAGARYWIPSQDEWVKTAHYDPNKNGTDVPGYWTYNTTSDTAPIVGAPGVGQTNAGSGDEYPSGSYPGVVSPWGLLDTSSGVHEWMEDAYTNTGATLPSAHFVRGSGWAWGAYFDRIDRHIELGGRGSVSTLRLARPVPSPGTTFGGVFMVISLSLQRRRKGSRP